MIFCHLGCASLSGCPVVEMASVLEEASFSLTTKVTVISTASYLGLCAITQLDIAKATVCSEFFFIPVFWFLSPLCLFWNAFWANSLLAEECHILLHWLINIYAWEQHKALFWMLSRFTVSWLLAWSLYLENIVYTCMLFWLNFLFLMGLQPVLHENYGAYCDIFIELSGYLNKAKWKIGDFFSRCITAFYGELYRYVWKGYSTQKIKPFLEHFSTLIKLNNYEWN